MLIVLDIDPSDVGERVLMGVVKELVETQARANAVLVAKHKLPALYQSGIRFENEPWLGRCESVASATTVLKRGWGDCAHLAAYRIGELISQGVSATCKVYRRPVRKSNGRVLNLFHVEVRLPDGSVEDPSRLLGM